MIVDTSALVAILSGEAEADVFAELVTSTRCLLSVGTFIETAIVVDAQSKPLPSRKLDDLVRDSKIELVPVTAAQANLARQAYRDYGKGSGHPARLNFGDCFAFALAKETGMPLLYKGDDFSKTEIKSARQAPPAKPRKHHRRS
jgi:ribonuclease VapC